MSPDRLRRFALVYHKLPPRQKQAFDLYGEGYKYGVIADIMFVTRNTVKQNMYHLRHKFPYDGDKDLQAQTAYFLGWMKGKYND